MSRRTRRTADDSWIMTFCFFLLITLKGLIDAKIKCVSSKEELQVLFLKNDNNEDEQALVRSTTTILSRAEDSGMTIWEYEVPPTPALSLIPYSIPQNNKTYLNSQILEIVRQERRHDLTIDTTRYLYWNTNENSPTKFFLQNVERKKKTQKEEHFALISQFDPRYVNLHSDLITFDYNRFIHQELRDAINGGPKSIANYLQHSLENSPWQMKDSKIAYYLPQIFSNEFLQKFNEELKHAQLGQEKQKWKLRRPNTMNRYGFVLEELKMSDFLKEFLRQVLLPLSSVAYPDWGGDTLDSSYGFTVRYRTGEDLNLTRHMDLSEITLNINLERSADLVGSDLFVDHVFGGSMQFKNGFTLPHPLNAGILHPGQTFHGASQLISGERQNLILWGRSQSFRSTPAENYFRECMKLNNFDQYTMKQEL